MTVAAGYCILPVLDQKKACQKGTFWSKTAEHFSLSALRRLPKGRDFGDLIAPQTQRGKKNFA